MICFEGELWIRPERIIKKGQLLIDNGKVIAVGESIALPTEVRRVFLEEGQCLLPGFIDVHTHLGLYEEVYARELLNERSALETPWVEAHRGLRLQDMGFQEALFQGGVTTVAVLPGSSNIVGGIGCVVKTAGQDRILKKHAGLKVSLGDNILSNHESAITSKMAVNSRLMSYFSRISKEGATYPGEVWVESALNRELWVRVHCHRSEDIQAAIELKEKFNLKLMIEHGTEAHYLFDLFENTQTPCITGPYFVGRPKVEMANLNRKLITQLYERKIPCTFMTDYPSNPPEMLRVALLEVIKQGIPREEALRMITLTAAELLGVDNRVGSLEVGKDADCIIYSGSPFEYGSQVERVFVGGEEIRWQLQY